MIGRIFSAAVVLSVGAVLLEWTDAFHLCTGLLLLAMFILSIWWWRKRRAWSDDSAPASEVLAEVSGGRQVWLGIAGGAKINQPSRTSAPQILIAIAPPNPRPRIPLSKPYISISKATPIPKITPPRMVG